MNSTSSAKLVPNRFLQMLQGKVALFRDGSCFALERPISECSQVKQCHLSLLLLDFPGVSPDLLWHE